MKVYYSECNGKKKYENLTQKDRIVLRNAKNAGRPLSSKERIEIFGNAPVFVKR